MRQASAGADVVGNGSSVPMRGLYEPCGEDYMATYLNRQDVRDALHVFLEDVNNDVPSAVPLSVPYELKLRAMRDKFGAFVRSEADVAESEAILLAVSASSLGAVGEIEQEQEREREREKVRAQQQQ